MATLPERCGMLPRGVGARGAMQCEAVLRDALQAQRVLHAKGSGVAMYTGVEKRRKRRKMHLARGAGCW